MRSIEWAAGLFEGEGCISLDGQLVLQMADYDVVSEFLQTIGAGSIRVQNLASRPSYKGKAPFAFRWTLRKKKEVRKVLSNLLPYFGNRRAYKALNILDDLELAS
jgi:hypothetical protein